MRQIDADAYAAEMKKRQDTCMDAMADAHSDRMYTENEHWAGVLAAFAEAKITLDKMPTVGGWVSVKDRMPEKKCGCLIVINSGWRALDFWEGDGWAVSDENEITHWMPLPEPPDDCPLRK